MVLLAQLTCHRVLETQQEPVVPHLEGLPPAQLRLWLVALSEVGQAQD